MFKQKRQLEQAAKKQELKKKMLRYHKVVHFLLDQSLEKTVGAHLDRSLVLLEGINEDGELLEFMKQTNYSVFDWSIKNHSIVLLDFLLTRLREETHYLMVEHDDYMSLKLFVSDTLHMSYEEYQKASSIKENIFSKIIAIDKTAILSVIQQQIAATKKKDKLNIEAEVLNAFKNMINKATQNPVAPKYKPSISIQQAMAAAIFASTSTANEGTIEPTNKRQRTSTSP